MLIQTRRIKEFLTAESEVYLCFKSHFTALYYDWRYSNQSGAGKSLETGKGSEMQRMTKCPFDLAYSAELLTGEFPVVGVIP